MHLIVALYASPKKCEMFEDVVNHKLKYPFEGDMRGFTRPFLSRLPLGLYDIRCKREIAPMVLRDISATFCENDKPSAFFKRWTQGEQESKINLDHTRFMSRKIYFAVRMLRMFTGLKDCRRQEGAPQIKMIGWHYCWFIGAWPDAIDKDGKEVL
jgi:hypothetical protein